MTGRARKKKVLITGITGQDGSYLAELLLKKGYEVFGIVRKTSNFHYDNIGHIQERLNLIYGDLLDPVSLVSALRISQPDEIYNLASQSVPAESFKQPIHTSEITAVGPLRLLDAVRDVCPKARFYQASSSEMFGWVREIPQTEETSFNPANPYAAAKLFAHNMAKIYRESYKMFVCCGILFNHESPRRNLNFVTQKVAYAAACAKLGVRTSEHLNEAGEPIFKNGKVTLGNLDAKRDWGFAGDYVQAMWLMMQEKNPDDYVIATGEVHTVRELCETAFSHVSLNWEKYVTVSPWFIRPTETGPLVGNARKAAKKLGWKAKVDFKRLIGMLVDANVARLR
jgi:GDPmannose 4,6-dehydratase